MYKAVDLDIQDVDISLKEFNKNMLVSVKMPALRHWEVDGVQITNFWFLPDISTFELKFENFKFDFDAYFKLDDHGYLDPIV